MQLSKTKITGITSDSRNVKSGYLFAALPGVQHDGREYINDALQKGAMALLVPDGTEVPEECEAEVITSSNIRKDFALLVSRFYLKQPDYVVAVTGTNGKTSTAYFVQQIWEMLGVKGASLGTLGVHSSVINYDGGLTTPDPVKLHEILAELSDAGVDHLAMEASSHGLDQHRQDGVKIQAAAFTNLSQDHLDYHETMEVYFAAKARLFSELLKESGVAVLNSNSEYFQKLKSICLDRKLKILDYGEKASFFNIKNLKPVPNGLKLNLKIESQTFDFILPLVGMFQAENALAAAGLVYSEGAVDIEDIIACLEKLKGVPGRLQYISGHPSGAAVYVDYAHTPDALKTVLKALQPHTTGRLICLFGCGGDRDRTKRPLMGKAVQEGADVGILTDDNPRSEDPAAIRADVLKVVPDVMEIGDRYEAIRTGMEMAQDGDIFVITGKGHESGQSIGTEVLPFDDAEEAQKAIEVMRKS